VVSDYKQFFRKEEKVKEKIGRQLKREKELCPFFLCVFVAIFSFKIFFQ